MDNVHINNLAEFREQLENVVGRSDAESLLDEAYCEAEALSSWACQLASELSQILHEVQEGEEGTGCVRDIEGWTDVDWEPSG